MNTLSQEPCSHQRRRLGRSLSAFLLAPCAVLGLATLPVMAHEDGPKAYWKNGTRIEAADGSYAIKIGGRIQADFSAVSADDELDQLFDFEGGSEFRRARLFVEGTVYKRFEFKAQYDFAGGSSDFKDVYVGIKGIPTLGGIRVGHFKEPFGFEELTSSKYMPFVERSLNSTTFAPSRNMGVQAKNTAADGRMTWAFGLFQDMDNFGESRGDEVNATARLTGLPVYQNDGEHLLHLGLGLSHRGPVDDAQRYRTRPEAHLAPRLVDTGSFSADAVDLIDLELVAVQGPFWAQGSYTQADADVIGSGSATLSGWNVQAGWFFTGETKAYKTSSGAFDRQKPASDFLKDGGPGAWEIAVRYSTIDLNDGPITGGEQDGLTFALNWYMNPAFRTQLNYVKADLDGVGEVDYALLRFAMDF